jgi:hypothetical protein
MTKSVRNAVVLTAAAVVVIGVLMAIEVQRAVFHPWRGPGAITVIRHPDPPARKGQADSTNIAPLATVTVSSSAGVGPTSGEGVADGTVDVNDWIAQGETSGAWIKLSWDRPATIHEIDLFDLPEAEDNVLGGMLLFDDGSSIAVDALPPTGAARRVIFPTKVVHSVMFRIDRAQGPQAGLAEIMVMGSLLP